MMFLGSMPLAIQTATALRAEMLMWLAVPSLLAIGIFGMILQKQIHGTPKWMKFLAMIPLLAAIIYGWGKLSQLLGDPAYADYNYIGSGLESLHWASVIVPVVIALALTTWGIIHDKRELSDI
ncbi:MAG: hypothetical protein KF812_08085 [Fimbriimonadaceae bacterium]|nr:hypothetical protein [Fimbriimonadaceae bacterium]